MCVYLQANSFVSSKARPQLCLDNMLLQSLHAKACREWCFACAGPAEADIWPVCWQVNGMLLNDKKVYVGPFLKRDERPDDGEQRFTNVYVKNLAESVSDERLNEMFSEFGAVTSAVVMKVLDCDGTCSSVALCWELD